jgi:hypothetical protein
MVALPVVDVHLLESQVDTMSMMKLNWLGSPSINRKRKSNQISKRYSAACLSTSWFGNPGDLGPAGLTVSAEYARTKG